MRITVLGIGNTLLADEGFGPRVLEELGRRLGPEGSGRPDAYGDAEVDLVDGGVLGFKLLPYFLESDAVVVLDAMDAGGEPGALFRFTPEEAELQTSRPPSAHETGLPHLLQTAALLGASPEVVIVACQVRDMDSYSEELTQEVAASVPRAADLALCEVERILTRSA